MLKEVRPQRFSRMKIKLTVNDSINMSATKRKSRRRSSLAPSRIKLQTCGTGGDLHKLIDPEKSAEERLSSLARSCLEYTLQKLEEEMKDISDFQSLRKEIQDNTLRKIARLEEDESFQKCCRKERRCENPYNIEMDTVIESLEGYRNRLTTESNKWDELVKESEDRVTIATQKPMNQVISEIEIPADLKLGAKEYLTEKMDMKKMLLDLDNTTKEVSLMVNENLKTVNLLKRIYDKAVDVLDQKSEQLHAETFKGISSSETPRRLINNVVSIQTPE